MFALISSRMAAWGQPPVSIARILDEGRALFLIKNSWSSRVKMSFVTVASRERLLPKSGGRCSARTELFAHQYCTPYEVAGIMQALRQSFQSQPDCERVSRRSQQRV